MPDAFQKTLDQATALKILGGDRRHVLLFGGARSGKTFILVYALFIRAIREKSRHVIIRRQFKDVWESIGMDTFPKVASMCFPCVPYELNRSRFFVKFPNGSEIWFAGLDDKGRADKILGKEFATIYFNECSELSWGSVETAHSRLAQKTSLLNKCYYDCNPPSKSHWSYKLFSLGVNPTDNVVLTSPELYSAFHMNPEGNRANLADGYIENILRGLSAKKRERFLFGEWQDDNENALWRRESMINPYRVKASPTHLERIVIGVDPAVTQKETSDHTGIVAAGCKKLGGQMHYYVLDDRSLVGSPHEWAATAVNAYNEYMADRVVAEVNQGGDMVEQTIRNVDRRVSYSGVRATRGKIVRAEPIAELYERGLVHHVGEMPLLEDEMCSFCGFDNEKSPDRMDALVWALTELSQKGIGTRAIFAE